MNVNDFTPKLWTVFKKGISKQQLITDSLSGVIVGIVALPLAIAFAIASGVSPEKGLITAIIGGFIISAFGGSRVQIGGPTGAFIVIVYEIVEKHGVEALSVATFMAGFIIILMGLVRLGHLIRFISQPLIVGFTSGIAVIIFSSQVKDAIGLSGNQPADFIDKWQFYLGQLDHINWYTLAIALFSIAVTSNFARLTTKIPGSLVAILISTASVLYFDLPVATIATEFGNIPNSLPAPVLPALDVDRIRELIQPAFAIALLGSIESLLSAVVADGMIGGRHRSNAELLAQGSANIFSGLFGGIPATGAIARTVSNIKNGGRTPIAGMIHAITLLLIMLLLAPLAAYIPLACLAGILIVIAYHMSEWKNFLIIMKSNRSDVFILLLTFFLTILVDLIAAIEIGMVLSSFMFMKRMSDSLSVQNVNDMKKGYTRKQEQLFDDELPDIPDDVILYEINGPLFFAAANKFQDTIRDLKVMPKIIILRMRNVPFIDATAAQRLKALISHFASQNVNTILSGIRPELHNDLSEAGIVDLIGEENILLDIKLSLERAVDIIGEENGVSTVHL